VSGGCYHVILRGNHQEPLFGSHRDRQVLNDIVADSVRQMEARIHAFCWMTNHLHACIQVSHRPLGQLMHRVAVRYSRYRHRILAKKGHLFERRYRAKLIDVDAYFLTLLRYIHLNPVKARLVDDPSDYPWSSHCAYLGLENIGWLTTEFGLALFSNDLQLARDAYRQFVGPSAVEDVDLEGHVHPVDPRVIGGDEFLDSVQMERPRPRSFRNIEDIAKEIASHFGITVARLCSSSRARSLTDPRLQLISTALEEKAASMSEIARFLNRDPSALSKLVARHSRRNHHGW
jgi:REP element-mobilizing transposase RayT